MTITRTLGAVLLAASGLAAPTLLATPAHAVAACTTSGITAGAASDGDKCTVTGTLTLTGGSLTAKPPTALAWGGTVGTDQQIVDTTTAHQSIEVDDLTGSGNGWHLTAAATTFTTSGATPHTLPDPSTLKVNGSTSNDTLNAAPTAACAGTDACTLPVSNVTSYPVSLPTATTPTAVSIYSAKANSGLGKIALGGLGWWIHVPADAYSGVYTSTITLSVVSAP